MRGLAGSMALLATALALANASAQTPVSSQDLRNFTPPTDPEGGLFLEKPATEGSGAYNVGVWFSYANQLLVVESSSGTEAVPLEHQYSVDYVASLGFSERVSVGIAVPTVVYQSGDEGGWLGEAADFPKTGIGDVRADVKLGLVEPGTLGTLALGVLARGTLPTSPDYLYAGYDFPTGELRGLGELSFVTTKLQATAGFHFRGETEVAGETLGYDLPWGVAALWNVAEEASSDRWLAALETHGSIGLEPSFAAEIASPVLAGLSLRWLAEDWSLLGGVEASLNSGLGGPRLRAVLSAGYAPRVKDADADTLEDHLDQCPEVAEDKDNFQDSDGCPEVDNDGDGVSDTDDKCPKELEDLDDFQDVDGCPEPDNDEDGIPDASDACALEPGVASEVPKYHGCPALDSDTDAVFDDKDRCPRSPEDKDGFKDEDGCPERDNDGDRIKDERDACPDQAGPRRSDPKLFGCPNPDLDGDTFDGGYDACPKQAESFNGFEDEDGCPDAPENGANLITMSDGPNGPSLQLVRPIQFVTGDGGVEIAPDSLVLLRAIALQLNQHPSWVLLVGVRPTAASADAEQEAINKSFAIVFLLSSLTHRDGLAESVSFEAVKGLGQAKSHGVGLMVLAPKDSRKAP